MMVVVSLVAAAVAIILATAGWGWSRGTVRESPQERIDREFEAIVRRFRASG